MGKSDWNGQVPAGYYVVPTATSTANYWSCRFVGPGGYDEYLGDARLLTAECPYGHTEGATQCNATCDAPWSMVDGQCVAPPPDVCAPKNGQSHGFKVTGNQNDANAFYKPVGNTWASPNQVSTGGCNATVAGGHTKCTIYGDGRYSCVGSAVYDGTTTEPETPAVPSDECTDCPEEPSTPTSDGSSECTNWVEDAEGRRTRQCETTAEANVPGRAACLTNGSLVCVSPSPTPESDTKTRTDDIKETTNADGSKTTDTTSTTTKTYCLAGACTTTNTTTKTTVVTDSGGNTTSETSECTGDDCAEPEEDEGVPDMLPLVELGEPGNFAPEEWDEKIEEAKQLLSEATGGLTASFSQFTSLGISASGGALPCTSTPAILGRSYSFCLSEFQDELLVIGNAIFLIACLFAAFIVFRP